MKPTQTSHILRSVLSGLASTVRIDSEGFLSDGKNMTMPNPMSYTNSKKFAVDYQAYNLARKREPDTATTQQVKDSLDKWIASEHKCSVVNRLGWWCLPVASSDMVRLKRVKRRTAYHISRILSDVWPVLEFNSTAGATATTARKYSFGFAKLNGMPLTLNSEPHKCNPASMEILAEMFHNNPAIADNYYRARWKLTAESPSLRDMPSWAQSVEIEDLAKWCCENVPPAKFTYVPKDTKSVRFIAQSNTLSICVQKTYGDAIRKALLLEGVDLNDQEINQQWAEIGSHTGLIATVDLSSASDSICLRHLELFPRRWQEYFLSSRDTHIAVNGVVHKLNMVAGMGNGFIFELQSLLYYAIALSVVEELDLDTSFVNTYGDDIIIPSRAYDLFTTVMLALGFEVNEDKSYATGPFRESCGKHYFNGQDVSPWYARSDASEVEDLYHYFNGLSEWQHRIGADIQKAIDNIASNIPRKLRTRVPNGFSERSGLLYSCDGEILPTKRWCKKYQCFVYRYAVSVDKTLDVMDRLPDRMRLTAWFDQAEDAAYLVCRIDDPLMSVKYSPKLRDFTVAKAEWSTGETVRKHGRVSDLGDA